MYTEKPDPNMSLNLFMQEVEIDSKKRFKTDGFGASIDFVLPCSFPGDCSVFHFAECLFAVDLPAVRVIPVEKGSASFAPVPGWLTYGAAQAEAQEVERCRISLQ